MQNSCLIVRYLILKITNSTRISSNILLIHLLLVRNYGVASKQTDFSVFRMCEPCLMTINLTAKSLFVNLRIRFMLA